MNNKMCTRAVVLSSVYLMESINGESSKELLEAQSHLWNHIFSFINSMSLKCAVELGIPDIIHSHGKPITLSELATALSIPPSRTPCLQRLMRLLVHSGFFTQQSNGDKKGEVFSLTTFSTILLKEKGTCVSQFVILMLDQTFSRPWHFLSAWLTGEKPATAFKMAHGMGVWEATGERPEFNSLMNEGMASDASFTTKLIIRDCGEVFRGLRSLVDVGGGTGTMARAIAEALPQVKCTVFDLPHVIATLGESKLVEVVGGDMFEYIPPADAMLLKWVLHDWSDDECVEILKRCKEAIPSKEDGGKVIIIDMVMNTDNVHQELAETQLLFDIHMMVHTTGKQRDEQEWQKIFANAGFRDYKIIPALGLRSVIEVYR